MSSSSLPTVLPPTIKAWRFHSAANGGPHKNLRLEDIPAPKLSASKAAVAPNTTIIKVLAASVNPVDVKLAAIPLVGRFLSPLPATPGRDAAGLVVQTNDSSLSPGQLVACRVSENQAAGVMAQYVAVSDATGAAVAVPEGVSATQAATVGTCGTTAVQALRKRFGDLDKLQVGGGEGEEERRVFVNGGSGGTGTYQIQIAKALGCHVTTTCSGANAQLCRDLGADEVLDYRTADVPKALAAEVRAGSRQGYDLVIDNVGVSWERYHAANEYLRPDGLYVQVGIGFHWQQIKQMVHINCWPSFLGGGRRRYAFMGVQTNRADMERVVKLMGEGRVKVPIDKEFEFSEVPQAYERLLGGRARGKIVVRMPETEESV